MHLLVCPDLHCIERRLAREPRGERHCKQCRDAKNVSHVPMRWALTETTFSRVFCGGSLVPSTESPGRHTGDGHVLCVNCNESLDSCSTTLLTVFVKCGADVRCTLLIITVLRAVRRRPSMIRPRTPREPFACSNHSWRRKDMLISSWRTHAPASASMLSFLSFSSLPALNSRARKSEIMT